MFPHYHQALTVYLSRWARNPKAAPPIRMWRNAFLDLEMPDGRIVESSGLAACCSMYADDARKGGNPCLSTRAHHTSIKKGRDAARFMHEVRTAQGDRLAILCAQCGMAVEHTLAEGNPEGLTMRYIGDVLADEVKWSQNPGLYMRAANVRLLTDEESERWIANLNRSASGRGAPASGVATAPSPAPARPHLTRQEVPA